MRPADLGRWFARAEVRTAAIVGSVLVLSVLTLGVLSYTYAAMEALEEADRWFEFSQQMALRQIEEHGATQRATDVAWSRLPDRRGAVRIRDASGRVLAERGDWPAAEHSVPALGHEPDGDRRDRLAFQLLRKDAWLVGGGRASSGARLEIALPLRHFASEASEQLRHITISGGIAALLVLGVGFGAVALAFAPLRRATALLQDVDAGRLALRLPSRGTGDAIDRHAETLNHVLERIDAAFARLHAFSSDVAHELRTPLNRISTVSEVALIGGGEPELRSALTAVHASTEDLAKMVRSLLLLAEIDDRRFALDRKPLDVAPWIAQHVDAFAPSFEEADVKLAAGAEPLVVQGDRTLLDRILANLLDNALLHAPAGSRVEVRARADAGGVSIVVDDAGRGVPPSERERIFDRFARLAGEAGPGHGVGLALARAIAELHGGRLNVATSPAGGARFELWLPVAGAHEPGPA